MSKIHSILAATDLSTPARHAAERAAQISQQHGAALCGGLFEVAVDQLKFTHRP